MSILKKLDLNRLGLYFYADPENVILPVIVARGSSRRHLEDIFSKKEPFKDYFDPQADGTFLFNKDALKETDPYNLPSQPYEVKLFENDAVFAPRSFSGVLNDNTNFIHEGDYIFCQMCNGITMIRFPRAAVSTQIQGISAVLIC